MSKGLPSLFVLGGARSGKSRYAVGRASALSAPTAFVATAQALDPDMARRIQRHRAERPRAWHTLEEPWELMDALRRLEGRVGLVIVDCLTLWVANRLQQEPADEPILAEAEDLAKLVAEPPYSAILVSNEVGLGVHPETAQGLRFRDLLGIVNQKIATVVDEVVWLAAGLPVTIKEQRRQ